jgi:hypothetical protein
MRIATDKVGIFCVSVGEKQNKTLSDLVLM